VNDVPSALRAGERGVPAVLLHGLGGNAESWRPQLDALRAHRRVVAWEMPGYGRSAPLPEMTFASVGDALERLLDADGLEAVHLVGHSLGAMVAQEFALARPDRVRSLALLAASGRFGPPGGDWQRRFVADRLAPLEAGHSMADIADDALPRLFAGPVDPALRELARVSLAAVPEATYRAALAMLAGFDALDRLPALTQPALLVAGDRDPMAPLVGMQRLHDALPRARMEVVPGAGHWLGLECPGRLNRLLLDFHADLDAAKGDAA
jgi:pimeloyl-ACP methyl ester carboxylesterase